jgi:E3 ubiquitin-protein ligase RNF14
MARIALPTRCREHVHACERVAVVQAARIAQQQLEDEEYVREHSKACPACGAAIAKDGGCNKVTCGLCGAHMCWTCEQVIAGYEHFRRGCTLVNEAQMLAWEAEWDRMVAEEERHGGLGGGGGAAGRAHRRRQRHEKRRGDERALALRCPRCGRANAKEGRNNHVKCANCLTDACFACRTMLQGPRAVRAHFGGAGGCTQHS